MYDDNVSQIHNLQNSNTEIRNALIDIIRQPVNNNTQRHNSNPPIAQNIPYRAWNIPQANIPQANREGRRQRNNRNTNFSNLSQYFQNFFEPIPIYPSHAQIENATRRSLYQDIVNPVNSSCPISLVPFNDNDTVTIIRHCNHVFHTTQLNSWFRYNCCCPVCRYDIRNYDANPRHVSTPTPESTPVAASTPSIDSSSPPPIEDSNSPVSETNQPAPQTLINNLTDTIINNFINAYSSGEYDLYFATADLAFDASFNFDASYNTMDASFNSYPTTSYPTTSYPTTSYPFTYYRNY